MNEVCFLFGFCLCAAALSGGMSVCVSKCVPFVIRFSEKKQCSDVTVF